MVSLQKDVSISRWLQSTDFVSYIPVFCFRTRVETEEDKSSLDCPAFRNHN